MTTTKRIGFCCKWINDASEIAGIKPDAEAKRYNTKTTTISWLNNQTKEIAEKKLWELMNHNIQATYNLIEKVGTLNENLRMVRISSDLLPGYTHNDYNYFWNQASIREFAAKGFSRIGKLARDLDTRISFHPGQYCVLASDKESIVEQSIKEFEYHVDMARWMGYGSTFHDSGFKINIHISGKGGPTKFLETYNKLSPEARNLITIENEENTWGLDDCLSICSVVPVVLDIHHHWCKEGTYIRPEDSRIQRIIDSWRGIRPVLHYSVSREDVLIDHPKDILPNHNILIESKGKRQKLRAHSDFFWNTAANSWALSFWEKFDIQCESKGKNLASKKLYEQSYS